MFWEGLSDKLAWSNTNKAQTIENNSKMISLQGMGLGEIILIKKERHLIFLQTYKISKYNC